MNVQSANFLSLLSGSDNVANLQQGLLGTTDTQGGFASALMEQLKLFSGDAGGTGPDMTMVQNWVDAAKNGTTPPDLHQFAALFGKGLPSAAKNSQDIDLEDTLQTLAGVLQQLQRLEADASSKPIMSTPNSGGESDETLQQTSADAGQAAQDPIVEANAAPPMPITVPAVETNASVEQAHLDSAPAVLPAGAQKPLAQLNSEVRGQNAANDAFNSNSSGASLDFNRSVSAMLAGGNAEGNPQQDKSDSSFKSGSLLDQIDSQGNQSDPSKSLPGVAADVAKLNQAVRADGSAASADQPAMLKHYSDPGWNKELGEKLIWMHKQAVPSVELRLNPEHLGPVLVKIDVSHDQASVAFTAQNQTVKEAIEAAIPKLREMLGSQQLNLADVNVSQQQSDQKQAPRDFFQTASDQSRKSRDDSDPNAPVNEAQNLVDEIEAGRAVASSGLLSLFA